MMEWSELRIRELESEVARLQAIVDRRDAEEEEEEDQWKRIVYRLVDAINGPRGQGIPEDVEHAVREVVRLQAIVDRLPKTADGVPITIGSNLYTCVGASGISGLPKWP